MSIRYESVSQFKTLRPWAFRFFYCAELIVVRVFGVTVRL